MNNVISRGLCAGAAGTTALNLLTYFDMLLTGRPASSTPAEIVRRLAEQVHCEEFAQPDDKAPEDIKAKRSTIGTLLGYANGLGIGMVAAMLYPVTRPAGKYANAALIGLAAMAASDVPMARLGVSDPKTWSKIDWLRDLVPHLAYGLATVSALEQLVSET
jgi:hypothetical protein